QMLAIGRALLTNPSAILLDEATEGLAPLVARDIWTMIAAIKRDGVAVVVVDRNLAALSAIADRVVILAKGLVTFTGTPADLASQPDVKHRHLGI
ncbi:MAG: ABC transporter ATP-binding protein, partial [Stellaceae bacterium]